MSYEIQRRYSDGDFHPETGNRYRGPRGHLHEATAIRWGDHIALPSYEDATRIAYELLTNWSRSDAHGLVHIPCLRVVESDAGELNLEEARLCIELRLPRRDKRDYRPLPSFDEIDGIMEEYFTRARRYGEAFKAALKDALDAGHDDRRAMTMATLKAQPFEQRAREALAVVLADMQQRGIN